MPNELMHHGVIGQRWGVRRYQNKDGTRTAAGKKRYSDKIDEAANTITKGAVIAAKTVSKGLSKVTERGEQKIGNAMGSLNEKASNAGTRWKEKNVAYTDALIKQDSSSEKVKLTDRAEALGDVITSSSAVAATTIARVGSNVIKKGSEKVNKLFQTIHNKINTVDLSGADFDGDTVATKKNVSS